jgi:hypothetical protein
MADRTVVLVAGALANKAGNGGEAWVRLSWAQGLMRLGFDVFFIEQIEPHHCVDQAGQPAPFRESVNRAWFAHVTREHGLEGRAALLLGGGRETEGLSLVEVLDAAGAAALLVNISGHLEDPAVLSRIRTRAYIDIDPGFTQFWHALGNGGARLQGHDLFFTIGENIGSPDCPIPTAGIDWHTVRQPVVLDSWPVTAPPESLRFTTIGSWRGPFGRVEFGGQSYGLKVHEFRKFLDLPERSPFCFEIALDIHPADGADLSALQHHGWSIADPHAVAGDPADFRNYVQASSAEFSVAQGIYVDTRSGWFSDRTVRYLASARPALVQDTGFGRTLPVGSGLVPFRTPAEAIRGAEQIASDYDVHARAARQLAQEFFESDVVLTRFVEEARIAP